MVNKLHRSGAISLAKSGNKRLCVLDALWLVHSSLSISVSSCSLAEVSFHALRTLRQPWGKAGMLRNQSLLSSSPKELSPRKLNPKPITCLKNKKEIIPSSSLGFYKNVLKGHEIKGGHILNV